MIYFCTILGISLRQVGTITLSSLRLFLWLVPCSRLWQWPKSLTDLLKRSRSIRGLLQKHWFSAHHFLKCSVHYCSVLKYSYQYLLNPFSVLWFLTLASSAISLLPSQESLYGYLCSSYYTVCCKAAESDTRQGCFPSSYWLIQRQPTTTPS